MLIPIIQTESIDDLQHQLDVYAAVSVPNKPTHIQIDVIDGIFADYYSVQPADLREINWHGYTHEYHLLVNDPDEYLGDAQSTSATTVIAQIERLHDRQSYLEIAKTLGFQVGLALDLYTPTSELTDAELSVVDIVLLMSVPAGFSGQPFNPLVLPKIHELHSRGFRGMIEIDGGVNENSIPQLLLAGATHLAINSALWHDGTVNDNLTNLMKVAAHVRQNS